MSQRILLPVALFALAGLARAAGAEHFTFTKLVDHVGGNFGPRTFTCASIDAAGDVAFKGTRSSPDGLNSWDVIARVSRSGAITVLAEDPERTQFQFFSNFVSINASGAVSFAAFRSDGEIAILRADGTSLVTIASTAGAFSSFGLDTSLNDAGEVAFTAALDSGEQGLFSGSGGAVTTHYTNAAPVLVDGVSTSLGGGNFGRPSINSSGEIAFWDRVEGENPGEGIFAGRSGVFRTLGPTDRTYNGAGDRGDANNNDAGIGAFETSFFDVNSNFVTELVTSNNGVLTTVASTLGGYGGFGFFAPAINSFGEVVFHGFGPDFTTDGIFSGPSPKKDAILTSKQRLDGARILSSSLSVGAEALNDAGEIVFIVDLEDSSLLEGLRTAIYLASPKRPHPLAGG